MGWTRRQMLELSAKLGLLSLAGVGVGCQTDDDDDSTPSAGGWPPFEGCDPETVDWAYEGDQGPESTFSHGIASGDPLADAVILWTRITTDSEDPVEVLWEISETPDFATVYASGLASATAARDWTVKVDATCLRPGLTWYYRFQALGRTSVTGRTRTANYGPTDRLRFAFCSCSSFAHGWYHAYRAMAEHADLDVVFHLGDYCYEQAEGDYGDVRPMQPTHETVTLEDKRLRYAHHRSDPDLQEVHRQHPFVCTWDDHEFVNDTWSGGSQDHDPETEGTWEDRLANGMQAYMEWLPVREELAGIIYRRLLYGDLLDVLVLDTRVVGRDQKPTTTDEAYDPDRQLLGELQEQWLLDRLSGTPARWTLLAQQLCMGQWSFSTDDQGRPRPLNQDSWDGYQAARRTIFDHIASEGVQGVVVISGDVHSSWANDLALDFNAYDVFQHNGSVAVEAVCPGISSPGTSVLDALFNDDNQYIRFQDSLRRGFVVCEVNHEQLQADWHLLPVGSVEEPEYTAPEVAASFVVNHGQPWWEPADGPLEPVSGAQPLAP
jgi:alkaline phosphatase D